MPCCIIRQLLRVLPADIAIVILILLLKFDLLFQELCDLRILHQLLQLFNGYAILRFLLHWLTILLRIFMAETIAIPLRMVI